MGRQQQQRGRDDEGSTNPESYAARVKRLAREKEADEILKRDRAASNDPRVAGDELDRAEDARAPVFYQGGTLEITLDAALAHELEQLWRRHEADDRVPGWWVSAYCAQTLHEVLHHRRQAFDREANRARDADIAF
jgi:hypothetical protein